MELEQQLRKYYSGIFPCEEIFNTFRITTNRELSFYTQQDTYLRYVTCDSAAALRDKIQHVLPKKIDIGAEYDRRPTKMSGAQAISHELVFDVDLTDYPRECCEDKTVCKVCFEVIKCAIKLFDFSLRQEFGFKEIGFVFSGRRGVHCWVFDDPGMSTAVRHDIVKFYQHVLDKNLNVTEYQEIMREFGGESKDLIQKWYLRIDKSVTTTMNHLVKLPFSVHPDSLKIAVPIDPDDIPELESLPSLADILQYPHALSPYIRTMRSWRNQFASQV